HTRFSRDWSSDVCSSDLSFSSPIESPYHWGNNSSTARVVDYNGDGMADLFYEAGLNWYVLLSTGTGFTQVFVSAKADLPTPFFQDFDGDGLQDALWSAGFSVYWRRNTGGALAAAQVLYTDSYAVEGLFQFDAQGGGLDVNGD